MSNKLDRDYYRARLAAERVAAEQATSEVARVAHAELAEQYEQLLSAEGSRITAANES